MPQSSILTTILDHKRTEVTRQQRKISYATLRAHAASAAPVRDFAAALRLPGRAALIAEVKKASPSRGVLIEHFDPLAIAQTYVANGAAALSVLTDVRFFQGSLKYLEGIRALDLPTPLLRKDFIIDAYQIAEARAYGADALLLIVAALEDAALAELLAASYEMGMHALVEVHDAAELERALAVGAQLIGVNNRNLHTFTTELTTTQMLAARLPVAARPLLVSESGIASAADAALVHSWGADAILVGEALVTAEDIGARVRALTGERP